MADTTTVWRTTRSRSEQGQAMARHYFADARRPFALYGRAFGTMVPKGAYQSRAAARRAGSLLTAPYSYYVVFDVRDKAQADDMMSQCWTAVATQSPPTVNEEYE